jgi:DNA relaxase NicK
MNERIKELAEQAANEIADQFKPGFFDNRMVEDVANIIYKHHEKFAELIVRECSDIVAKRKDQAIDEGWNVDEAMSTAEIDLKEHFGVE